MAKSKTVAPSIYIFCSVCFFLIQKVVPPFESEQTWCHSNLLYASFRSSYVVCFL